MGMKIHSEKTGPVLVFESGMNDGAEKNPRARVLCARGIEIGLS
jgi:hypothetical protein